MDLTPGRAIYNPDETVKPLRQPKMVRPDGQTTSVAQQPPMHHLSASATEFVPRHISSGVVGVGGSNTVQTRLQRHQTQYIAETYPNYQQQSQQQEQEQQQYNNHQTHSNGFGQQQYQQQQQQQQQHQQMMAQMNSMHVSKGSSVQDRLHISNNSRSGGSSGGGGADNGGHITFFPQNQTYNNRNYGKHHHNHQHYNNHHSYQHQQHRHNHYHNQHQTYPEPAEDIQSPSEAPDAASSVEDMQGIALDYLQSVIQCLNQNPGQFDSIATRFITIFDGMENNHYVLSIAMEDIFKESIRNPNFRYMGAKLYNLLHTLNPQKESMFHTLLKYKLDFHQNEMSNYMEKHQENKVRETALFLAELYMQLRGDDSRIYLIAQNIVQSLKQLFQHVTNENVRCICLTLKLAGFDLSTDCPREIMEIIGELEKINTESPGKYPLASNVIALQKNNWGRKMSGSESLGDPETTKPPGPPRASDDPVFYGPDGREITSEECDFLTNGSVRASNNETGDGSTDNDDDLEELDPEMDEETARDFKLFLKQANST